MRSVLPADPKWQHLPMDCYEPTKMDLSTSDLWKAQEYRKLRAGAYELKYDQKMFCSEAFDGEALKDSAWEEQWLNF